MLPVQNDDDMMDDNIYEFDDEYDNDEEEQPINVDVEENAENIELFPCFPSKNREIKTLSVS